MMTKGQVEQEFRGELYALLRKWAATLEADDHFKGYPECGEDIRMIVTIPALYADEQRTTEREYTEIDFGKYVTPNAGLVNRSTDCQNAIAALDAMESQPPQQAYLQHMIDIIQATQRGLVIEYRSKLIDNPVWHVSPYHGWDFDDMEYRIKMEPVVETTEDAEFAIGDIVSQNGHDETPLEVTGYIRDEERLFVRDPSSVLSKGKEFELHFCEVTEHWRKVPKQQRGLR